MFTALIVPAYSMSDRVGCTAIFVLVAEINVLKQLGIVSRSRPYRMKIHIVRKHQTPKVNIRPYLWVEMKEVEFISCTGNW
jgi:hypothetical protein